MDLKDLYRDVILDHNKHPRNVGKLCPCDTSAEGHNPLCGDRLSLTLRIEAERIADIRFEGKGCAISTASASLMCEAVKGQTLEHVEALRANVHRMLTGVEDPPAGIGKLAALAGVRDVRVNHDEGMAYLKVEAKSFDERDVLNLIAGES